ncbi:RidA family protein [Solimicrobium silvestre]|uniref:Putative translation initiation inhibitor yjgF family n=1 Tax=Solimicrobium silvestre TaxID=2099400 RepID=A0A2S9GX45_9BURK|nr:RidA family protein [Solimicrobium silvestre]PRC92292.1 putative translation initiation inhibitor yjgF family [Solimicrobium silvestre]
MQNQEIKRFHVGTRMSEMAVYNRTVYLAGQVTADDSLDIAGQTSSVLAQIDTLLAEAGTDKSHILMCQIYLSDLTHFAAMNQVWEGWVAKGNTPPRATVQAALANPAWLIEVVITAALKAAN